MPDKYVWHIIKFLTINVKEEFEWDSYLIGLYLDRVENKRKGVAAPSFYIIYLIMS